MSIVSDFGVCCWDGERSLFPRAMWSQRLCCGGRALSCEEESNAKTSHIQTPNGTHALTDQSKSNDCINILVTYWLLPNVS